MSRRNWINIIPDHPWSITIAVMLLTVFFLPGAVKVMGTNAAVFDFKKEMPKDHPVIQACDRFDEIFGEDVDEAIAIESKNGLTPELLNAIIEISDAMEQWPTGVAPRRVISLETFRDSWSSEDGLIESAYLLDDFKKNGAIEGLKQRIKENPLIINRLVSKDLSTHKLIASFDSTSNQKTVFEKLTHLVQDKVPPGYNAYLAGRIVTNSYIDIAVQKQIRIYGPIALLSMIITLLIFLGPLEMAGTILVVAIALVWTLGIMGYTNTPLNVLTSSLPILLLAIGNAYGIHLCYWMKKELSGQVEKAPHKNLWVNCGMGRSPST